MFANVYLTKAVDIWNVIAVGKGEFLEVKYNNF